MAGWHPSGSGAFAELGQRRGFDLFVMYGATEATARMSVLPSDLAAAGPTSIGRPLPGASFRLDAARTTTASASSSSPAPT